MLIWCVNMPSVTQFAEQQSNRSNCTHVVITMSGLSSMLSTSSRIKSLSSWFPESINDERKKEKAIKSIQGNYYRRSKDQHNTSLEVKFHSWILLQFHKTTGEIGFYVRSHELTQFDITSKVNARPENRNFLSCIRFKPEKLQTLTLPDSVFT